MPTPATADPPLRSGWAAFRPWRSAPLGWAVTALVLVGGVPLFLRAPPWVDVTHYDVAVRTLFWGGVLYRDLFDTNLPGVVWVMAGVRAVAGWSYEALRAWDLLVVGVASALLGVWARWAGASASAVAWYAAAIALYYPFTSEFNHCQRDVWMLLPAAGAGLLRVRQVGRAMAGEVSTRAAIGEGFVWGLAVWLKPHVLAAGGAAWAVSAVLVARRAGRKAVGVDLLGLVAGGLLAGVPGVVWLVSSGAWPYLWEVLTGWNPDYLSGEWENTGHKLKYVFWCFRPWGLVHMAALPLAAWDVVRAVRGRSGGAADDARGVLAGLYLGWWAQAVFVQKGFEYVHAPLTILALAVLAGRGWGTGFAYLVGFAVLSAVWLTPGAEPVVKAVAAANKVVRVEPHPLADPAVLRLWPRCFDPAYSPELRDRLGQYTGIHNAADWRELEPVAAYLRGVDPPVRDRELTAWHDSPHPLYLMVGVDPSTRYMHFGTVLAIRGHADEVRREVAASPQRYVVSDLARMTWYPDRAREPGAAGPLSLPGWFPRSQLGLFPWDQPVVFRSGRYVVHRVDHPPTPGQVVIPDWGDLGDLGPGWDGRN